MCPYGLTLREKACVLRQVSNLISGICDSQANLSDVMEAMVEDLEGAEVQELM